MAAPLKEKAARLALIAEVSDRMYDATESFETTNLGATLAYLYAAIAKGTHVTLDPSHHRQNISLLTETFPPEHPVWGYIEIDGEDLCCTECGHPMVVNSDGTTNHLVEDSSGTDEIDHDQDEDHVAYAEEE